MIKHYKTSIKKANLLEFLEKENQALKAQNETLVQRVEVTEGAIQELILAQYQI